MLQVSTGETESGEPLILIRDNGPGIPSDIRDSLFEPFVTSRNEGTGLGLAIVKQIVDQHGGSITASHLSDGTEFQLCLPRHQSRGDS
jgi:two-component system nitrogen regulation sensor histidine kinase GlnL